MIYLTNFIHAWLIFIAPLSLFNVKSSLNEQIIFTFIYGNALHLIRTYFMPIAPMMTHTVLLMMITIFLYKVLIKQLIWSKCILMAFIWIIALVIAELLITFPIMHITGITVASADTVFAHRLVILFTSNLGLIMIYAIGRFKHRKSKVSAKNF
ncbi:hypothetical protein RH915_06690 [Serpentinicella sp. ANB-PHB4]|uniref:hypothetical protein n=1 Tax=Serpentinicella sp. ANB-PHB4 TaxID=3074076 RepID=UPI00285A0871|nr:hypothetical protein [Serpentinicella sp. ANB-PHB4]MDR5659172.1 hypothetical protein [Serpentinicella sp. ANB-PHB4]